MMMQRSMISDTQKRQTVFITNPSYCQSNVIVGRVLEKMTTMLSRRPKTFEPMSHTHYHHWRSTANNKTCHHAFTFSLPTSSIIYEMQSWSKSSTQPTGAHHDGELATRYERNKHQSSDHNQYLSDTGSVLYA
jgi:hypothetical protein